MGYTTTFTGQFTITPELSLRHYIQLRKIYDQDRGGAGTQPQGYCQWVPTDDGRGLVWDGNEKFYHYVEWLQWLMANVLHPNGYTLEGTVAYQGELLEDVGDIRIAEGVVTKSPRRIDGKALCPNCGYRFMPEEDGTP